MKIKKMTMGRIINIMRIKSLILETVINMLVNLLMGKHTEKEFFIMQTEINMMVSGKMTNIMAKESFIFQMAINMMVNLLIVKHMAKEFFII